MNSPSHSNVLIVSYGGCRSCPWCCTRSALPLVYSRASYNPQEGFLSSRSSITFQVCSIHYNICVLDKMSNPRTGAPSGALPPPVWVYTSVFDLRMLHGEENRCLPSLRTRRLHDICIWSSCNTTEYTLKKRYISVKERPRCCCFCVFPRHCVKTKRNKA